VNTSSQDQRSPFAKALARLLDETSYFSRAEWARLLGISTAAISQWVNDRTLPRADLLRMVIETLRSDPEVVKGPITDFMKIAALPATDVSPLGARMMPSVRDYLEGSTLVRLGRELQKLSRPEQVRVLETGSWQPTANTPSTSGSATRNVSISWRTEAELNPAVDSELLPRLWPLRRDASTIAEPWQSLMSKRLVVLQGTAGCGKSSILIALAQALRTQRSLNPVLVSARDYWPANTRPLLNLLEDEDVATAGLVLVDGLDEVDIRYRVTAIRDLQRIARQYPEWRMIVASRPLPELASFRGFEKLVVAPLTYLQMIQSIERAYQHGTRFKRRQREELARFYCHLSEKVALRRSLSNPLFLKSALQLFERYAVTPFAEAEMVGEFVRQLLDAWDRERRVVRSGDPWASPHVLVGILGKLCFSSMQSRQREFTTADVMAWLGKNDPGLPIGSVLNVLSTQCGVLCESGHDKWRLVQPYLGTFLAATYVVESADRAEKYVRNWTHDRQIRNIYRLACGLTSDASPLLEELLLSEEPESVRRHELLAEALAQPLTASDVVLHASCERLIGWLERYLSDWQLEDRPQPSGEDVQKLWEMRASNVSEGVNNRPLERVLRSIHQARSGPVRVLMSSRLERSKSRVLVAFAASLKVEGRLKVSVRPEEGEAKLHAVVMTPGLA
jgi:hypothetical protein